MTSFFNANTAAVVIAFAVVQGILLWALRRCLGRKGAILFVVMPAIAILVALRQEILDTKWYDQDISGVLSRIKQML